MAALKEYKIEKRTNLTKDLYGPRTAVNEFAREALLKLTKIRSYKNIPGIKSDKVEDYKKLMASVRFNDFSLYEACFYKNSPVIIFTDKVWGNIHNAIIIKKKGSIDLVKCDISDSVIITCSPMSQVRINNSIFYDVSILSTANSTMQLFLIHNRIYRTLFLECLAGNNTACFDLYSDMTDGSIFTKNTRISLTTINMSSLEIYNGLDILLYHKIGNSKILIRNDDSDKVRIAGYDSRTSEIDESDFSYVFTKTISDDYQLTVDSISTHNSMLNIGTIKDCSNITEVKFCNCRISNRCIIRHKGKVVYQDTTPPAHYPRFIDFYGYKAVHYRLPNLPFALGVLKLYIPKDAIVRGSCSAKCRANKVVPVKLYDYLNGDEIAGEDLDHAEIRSIFEPEFTYKMNEDIEIKDFDITENVCSNGIHFFYDLNDLQEFAQNDVTDISTTQGIRKIIITESF